MYPPLLKQEENDDGMTIPHVLGQKTWAKRPGPKDLGQKTWAKRPGPSRVTATHSVSSADRSAIGIDITRCPDCGG